MDTKLSKRNNYLDWLRVLAIAFVFVYHSTRFFNLEDWELKNPVRYQWLDVWNIFSWNWMMPLIFVISGASLLYAAGKGGTGKFLKDKVLRLFVPWLFGLLTHATLQAYIRWTTHGLFSGSFLDFLKVYFGGAYANYLRERQRGGRRDQDELPEQVVHGDLRVYYTRRIAGGNLLDYNGGRRWP